MRRPHTFTYVQQHVSGLASAYKTAGANQFLYVPHSHTALHRYHRVFDCFFFFPDMKLIEEEEFDFDIPDDYLNIR